MQSHVAEHAQLCWLLECTVTYGELARMTQFKDKSGRNEVVRAGLFTYPVLMAADCFLYDTELVPVGDDQRQHLELARVLADRFNNRFGEIFVGPGALVPKVGGRVMDLQDPTRKMSKSEESPAFGTVGVLDPPEEIERKVRKAVTDTDGEMRFDPEEKPGLANLLQLLATAADDVHRSRWPGTLPLRGSQEGRGAGHHRGAATPPGAANQAGRGPRLRAGRAHPGGRAGSPAGLGHVLSGRAGQRVVVGRGLIRAALRRRRSGLATFQGRKHA